VLVVAPRALLHPAVPEPAGSLLYELVTGHPDRQPRELVVPADLAEELRAWPRDTAAPLTAELARVAAAVVVCWQRGDLRGLDLPLDPGEDARALTRPAMALARAALRARLDRQVARARCRWLHPSSGRRAGEPFLEPCSRGHGGAPRTAVPLRRAGCAARTAGHRTGGRWRTGRSAADPGHLSEWTPDTCPSGHRAPVRVDTAGAVRTPGRTLRRALLRSLADSGQRGRLVAVRAGECTIGAGPRPCRAAAMRPCGRL
jgi:hypothetical protein